MIESVRPSVRGRTTPPAGSAYARASGEERLRTQEARTPVRPGKNDSALYDKERQPTLKNPTKALFRSKTCLGDGRPTGQ